MLQSPADITKKAAKGDAIAQFLLARMSFTGDGVAVDKVKAAELHEKAAAQGHKEAMYSLAHACDVGDGIDVDKVKAVKWYERAAGIGHKAAIFRLAEIYALGEGDDVAADKDKARHRYEKAAALGDADAQFKLAEIYRKADGVPTDYDIAFEWYAKAARQDHPEAIFRLALCYDEGFGVDDFDPAKAKQLLRKASSLGLREAAEHLAFLEEHEASLAEFVKDDIKKANEGDPVAQVNLAIAYENGEGVEMDKLKAKEWYEKAAAQGNKLAKHLLARKNDKVQRRPTAQDRAKDVEKYTKAAQQGDPMAIYKLAVFHKDGHGVPADPVKFRRLLQVAVDLNLPEAINLLKHLDE
ncbi:MAG: sel1 repeat family protein [Deltaproteobacteria bacterium]|nr:sel1 repeat family protein [Deltaproteobacteria bacterium]